jgi:mRNA-degrading endonuclease toxin of MazEF toxin-antitoxin module
MLLKRPDGCNLEQFEASGHRLESGRKVLVVLTDVARQMSVWTEYHVIRTDARDLNFTVLISAQSLLEAYK